MNSELIKAKEIMTSGGYTCVLVSGEDVITSTERGVKPVLKLYTENTDVKGYYAADKIIGKATAFLYVLLGVAGIYTCVISKAALSVLTEYGIPVEYDTLTEAIINRKKDGFCPMETAVKDITDPADVPAAIIEKLKRM